MRCARSLLVLVIVVAAGGSGAAADDVPAAPVDIELRKSFRFFRRAGRQAERREAPGRGPAGEIPAVEARRSVQPQVRAVVEALGEHLHSSGTLHLPGVGAAGTALDVAVTPVLETATGRNVIIDRDGTIDPAVIEQIGRQWPAYAVVQPGPATDLRDLLGAVLEAAGYDSVLRSTPVTFGHGVTIRYVPDFFVARDERDLLSGETRAISIVEPADALPAELRELAGEHRVKIVELGPDGAPTGLQRPPWRDATGRVTTMESSRLAPIIEEIAGVLAEMAEPGAPARLPVEDEGTLALAAPADLTAAIGALLKRFALPAIGPAVEFYRAQPRVSTRRFVVRVPGWLVEAGGRRLLITGADLPLLVRLFLTREGIDIFAYRVAGR